MATTVIAQYSTPNLAGEVPRDFAARVRRNCLPSIFTMRLAQRCSK